MQLETLQRDGRARVVVTDIAVTRIHLSSLAGVGRAVHGPYRGKADTSIAVIALDIFPAVAEGKTYKGWYLRTGKSISLGTLNHDANGPGSFYNDE
jgi:hypothetical protein